MYFNYWFPFICIQYTSINWCASYVCWLFKNVFHTWTVQLELIICQICQCYMFRNISNTQKTFSSKWYHPVSVQILKNLNSDRLHFSQKMDGILFTFLIFQFFIMNVQCNLPTIRQTLNGPVEGVEQMSLLGQKYYAFRGIPFAEPPITGTDPYTGEQVNRRFKVQTTTFE